jgi:hypothetical protein
MDPDANLAEIRRLTQDGADLSDDQMERLVVLIQALDAWISKGGFLPKAWRQNEERKT